MSEPSYSGSVCQVVKQVPQIFHHINCSSHTDLPEARFSYFTEQVCALLIVGGQVCLSGSILAGSARVLWRAHETDVGLCTLLF